MTPVYAVDASRKHNDRRRNIKPKKMSLFSEKANKFKKLRSP
jgi:hypothetical protein